MICSHVHLNIYRISFLATFYPKIGLCKKWSPFPNIYAYFSAHVYFSRKLYFQAKLQKLCICQSRASGTHCGGPQTPWTSSLLRKLQFLQPSGSRIRNVKLHFAVLLKATWPLSKAFGVLIFLQVQQLIGKWPLKWSVITWRGTMSNDYISLQSFVFLIVK